MPESINFLNQAITDKDNYIILGCSGGPDSMCLLNILFTNNYKIICACINHNIRLESTDEYNYLKNYCKDKNIIFEGLELSKDKHQNEAYYRNIRQNFYKDLAKKYQTPYIATAHHGDDLIETILMRITRGSNLKGYSGFSNISYENEYIFLKPLIFYEKKDILEYNQKNNIHYFIDKTNNEDIHTRNRYRHHILPLLKNENPKVHLKYLEYSQELQETDNYINRLIFTNLDKCYYNKILNLTIFQTYDIFIQKNILKRILQLIYQNNIYKIKKKHIDILLNKIHTPSNFTLNFPNTLITREYDKLYFDKKNQSNTYKIELKELNVLPNGDIIKVVSDETDTSNFVTRINSKDIKLPLYIRNRCSGDTMIVKGSLINQKIKKIMIDKKIEKSQRDTFPIVIDANNQIIWLPGVKKSKFDNDKTKIYDIILKYERKEIGINEK